MVGAKPSVGFDGVKWDGGVCPGWAAQSPAVAEIADAYTAMSAGALRDIFPDVTNVVAEGLLEMKRSLNQYEWVQSLALKSKENANG